MIGVSKEIFLDVMAESFVSVGWKKTSGHHCKNWLSSNTLTLSVSQIIGPLEHRIIFNLYVESQKVRVLVFHN